MLRVIKELPSSTSKVATGQAKEPLLLKAFWDALPEEFEAKDFKATDQEVSMSIPIAERYIRQWVDTRLDKVSRGRYRKRQLRRSPGQKLGLFFVLESRSYTLLLVNSAKIVKFVS